MKSDRRSFLKGVAAAVPAAVIAPRLPAEHRLEESAPPLRSALRKGKKIRVFVDSNTNVVCSVENNARADFAIGKFGVVDYSLGVQDNFLEIATSDTESMYIFQAAAIENNRFRVEVVGLLEPGYIVVAKGAVISHLEVTHTSEHSLPCTVKLLAKEIKTEKDKGWK